MSQKRFILERDELGAVHEQAERSVERRVAERRTEVPDDYRLGVVVGLVELGKVLLHVVVHHQGDAVVAAIQADPDRQRRGRRKFLRGSGEAQALQALEDPPAWPQARV